MKYKLTATIFVLISLTFNLSARAELIILASPTGLDRYYEDFEDNIFDFHIEYVKQISKHDYVLIFTDEDRYDSYAQEIGENRVVIAPMLDIWMRDFSLSNLKSPIMFRYTAAAQGGGKEGQLQADDVQEQFAFVLELAGLSFKETNLLNDGGNFVDDYAGNVVISTKFLTDNKLSEDQARKKLKELEGINNVAFIEADEQGGLEHADGVVSFVNENTLIIKSYPGDEEYSKKLKEDLRRGLPDVKIKEVITPYDSSDTFDEKFGSACGLYTNALVTMERIYLPQFGIPEDKIALAQVKELTSREVIPVDSKEICKMGGGVRCMSWQLRGDMAKKLLAYFGKRI